MNAAVGRLSSPKRVTKTAFRTPGLPKEFRESICCFVCRTWVSGGRDVEPPRLVPSASGIGKEPVR